MRGQKGILSIVSLKHSSGYMIIDYEALKTVYILKKKVSFIKVNE